MNKIHRLELMIFLLLTAAFTQACQIAKTEKANKSDFETELTIFQNNQEYPITKESETVEVEKKEFSLRFYNKKYDSENKQHYAAQIAAFLDKSELDKIKVGMSKTDLPFFNPGSGMSPDLSGKYESLIFKNTGHHYTFYENIENNRLNLLEDLGSLLRLEFEIKALYYNRNQVQIPETNLNQFYLAFLIDKNLDGIIDKSELYKLTIKLQ